MFGKKIKDVYWEITVSASSHSEKFVAQQHNYGRKAAQQHVYGKEAFGIVSKEKK